MKCAVATWLQTRLFSTELSGHFTVILEGVNRLSLHGVPGKIAPRWKGRAMMMTQAKEWPLAKILTGRGDR